MTHPDTEASLAREYRAAGRDPEQAAQIAAMDIALGLLTEAGWDIDAGSQDPLDGAWATSPAGIIAEIRIIEGATGQPAA
jgi:hypothetical protein